MFFVYLTVLFTQHKGIFYDVSLRIRHEALLGDIIYYCFGHGGSVEYPTTLITKVYINCTDKQLDVMEKITLKQFEKATFC